MYQGMIPRGGGPSGWCDLESGDDRAQEGGHCTCEVQHGRTGRVGGNGSRLRYVGA